MKKKLGDFFYKEARKMFDGHQVIAMTGDTDRIVKFLMNRVAVVYYEGMADGLADAKQVVHQLREEKDAHL